MTPTSARDMILGQLEFYWQAHLWPRLRGLTDEEYLWEPVPGCWSLRPGADGLFQMQEEEGEPGFTTIAWRMAHVAVDVFYSRADTFFGGAGQGHMFDRSRFPASLPGDAAGGLALLERSYQWWRDGVAALSEEEFTAPLGDKGASYSQEPMATLVLHLSRETMHHGGEICLLRDLYAHRHAGWRRTRWSLCLTRSPGGISP
jgi:uncharacterized damage-inducible protein DinB